MDLFLLGRSRWTMGRRFHRIRHCVLQEEEGVTMAGDMYEIRLKCPTCDKTVSIKRYDKGIVRGVIDAKLAVERSFDAHFDFKSMNGMVAWKTIPMLEMAANKLGTVPDYNEFEDCSYPILIRQSPLPEETGRACAILAGWAKANPYAIWEVT